MIIKFKFRDTRNMPDNVMNNYVDYIESQVRDRHLKRNAFEKWDSDFDDIEQEEAFLERKLGFNKEDNNFTIINSPELTLKEKDIVSKNFNNEELTGVFSDVDADLDELKKKIGDYQGTVWIPIISLKEDDAIDKLLNKESIWMQKTREIAPIIGEKIGIPNSNLNWIAAFHEKPEKEWKKAGKQPHIHLLIWEKQPILLKRTMTKNNLLDMREKIHNNLELEKKHSEIESEIINKIERKAPKITEDEKNIKDIQKILFGDDEEFKNYDILNNEPKDNLSETGSRSNIHSNINTLEVDTKKTEISLDGKQRSRRGENTESELKDDVSLKQTQNTNTKLLDKKNMEGLEGKTEGDLVKETNLMNSKTKSYKKEVIDKHDLKALGISKNKLQNILENRDTLTKVKSKNAYDEMVENLLKIQRKKEKGQALESSDETVLEYAGLSLSTDKKTISEKTKDCISVSQDIRELSGSVSHWLYWNTDTFGNLKVEDARRFETELTNSLYENVYRMEMAENENRLAEKLNVTEIISKAVPVSIATQEETIQSLTTLSIIGLEKGEESVNIFKAIKEFTQNNNYGFGFNDINAIVSEADKRAKLHENVSNSSTIRSLNNLGYKAKNKSVTDIRKESFYKMIGSAVADSCKQIGMIKEVPASCDSIRDLESCLKFCEGLETPGRDHSIVLSTDNA